MSKLRLPRNYKTELTETSWINSWWEIEFKLANDPIGDAWFLLIEPWVALKEENVFYHRKSWNSVFAYHVNRSNPVEHLVWSEVRLSNAIDHMNYLADNLFEHGYVVRKSTNHVLVYWGDFFIGDQMVHIDDLDTEDALTGKSLVQGQMNYIVVRNGDWSIETAYDSSVFLAAKVDVLVWGAINSIEQKKVFGIGTKWETGDTGEQGPQWIQWVKGDAGTIAVWTVTTGAPGSSASISNVWSPSTAVLNFTIPRWDKGDQWDSMVYVWVWSSAETYVLNDVVYRNTNGNSYVLDVATAWPASSWQEPENLPWVWKLIARWASITGVPAGWEQVVWDWVVPEGETGITVTPNRMNQTITVTDNSTGDYVYYTETGIEWRLANDDTYMSETKTGTYVEWATEADDRIHYADLSVEASGWSVTFDGKIAYRNQANLFTKSNTFTWDSAFKWRVVFNFHDMWDKSGNFSFAAISGMNQKVTLTGWSNHVCTLYWMVQWVYVLFVAQEWTGWLSFNIANSWTVNWVAVIGASFVNDWSAANTAGTHIFTILVAETKAHITYNGTSV